MAPQDPPLDPPLPGSHSLLYATCDLCASSDILSELMNVSSFTAQFPRISTNFGREFIM